MPFPPVPRLAESIVLGQIQTYLDTATVVSPSTRASDALDLLRRRNFDQAPVVDGGLPIGYVLARDLEARNGTVAEHVRAVLPDALANELAPLEEALPWLERTSFLFVLRGRSISGFAVPSDLNRQPGRTCFYLAITELELALAQVVRAVPSQDSLPALLDNGSAKRVRGRLRKHIGANVEADVVAEMHLSDSLEIAGRSASLRRRAQCDDQGAWNDLTRRITDLRNRVAHATRLLIETDGELSDRVDLVERVNALLAEVVGSASELTREIQ